MVQDQKKGKRYMKKITKNVYEAAKYAANHPEESLTSLQSRFKVDRHTLGLRKDDYKLYEFHDDDYYYYLTDDEKAPVFEWLENPENTSITKLAEKYHSKSTTIKNRMKIMGYEYSPKNIKRKYNRDIFNKIDTKEKAYWLGFILADGYVNQDRGFLSIKLGAKDRGHLVKFMHFMGEDDESVIKEQTGGAYTKDNIVYSIMYSSRDMTNDLEKYGLFQRKSGKENPYDFHNDELNKAYIRGMIDGDGHVENGYFKYVGSMESCQYIKNFFGKYIQYQEDKSYIYEHGTIFSFELRNKEVNKALKDIYLNSSIYLDRKYDVVKQFA